MFYKKMNISPLTGLVPCLIDSGNSDLHALMQRLFYESPAQAEGNSPRQNPRHTYKKEWHLVYKGKQYTLTMLLRKPLDIEFLKEYIRFELQLDTDTMLTVKYEEYEGGDMITVLDRDDIKECLRRGVLFIT
jgi:hypothetical protein